MAVAVNVTFPAGTVNPYVAFVLSANNEVLEELHLFHEYPLDAVAVTDTLL